MISTLLPLMLAIALSHPIPRTTISLHEAGAAAGMDVECQLP